MPASDDFSTYAKKQDVDRDYRLSSASDLQSTRIVIGASDLWILSSGDVQLEVERLLKLYRRQLKEYIYHHPLFKTALVPYPVDLEAPELIQGMIAASAKAGVGPMASVAGAIASFIGKNITNDITWELIIENGGDIYLRSVKERCVAIYAGNSPFSLKIGLNIAAHPSGVGICTSAGTIGPSLSFGKADAAVVIAPDVALADAAATAIGNLINTASDLPKGIDFAKKIPDVAGVLLIKDDKMAAWGEISITRV
jgi:ApbE superfamily uncharacterized protein (UPF0280 family)